MPKQNVLQTALEHFMTLPYPGNCRGRNVYGIELMLLDADIYEVCERIGGGERNPDLLNRLGRLELDACMVLHALKNEAYAYYEQSRALARMALDLVALERGPVVALVEAIIADDAPDPDLLRSSRAVINERALGGDTPLTTAARLGRETWFRMLLANGADPAGSDGAGSNPLFYAVVSGQIIILKILADGGADLDARDKCNITPLWWALSYNQESVVAFLLKEGADTWAKMDDDERDLYEAASDYGLPRIAALIAQARAEKPEKVD